MSDTTRRAFLGAAAAAGASAAALPRDARADAGSGNAPDPLLSGKELPTFKFELEKSRGKVSGLSFGKEATVEQLPISKGMAGVSMRLAPGVSRELHWHANAAEWAYVVEGRCRTTVIDPGGGSETNDFDPGDVWYFPRGHGHSIQCLGDTPCHFILIFDNGYFSEFGTFSVTDWLGHAPPALLAKNLGLPVEAFAKFPKAEVYFTHGKAPPEPAVLPHQGKFRNAPETHKYRLSVEAPHSVHPGGREWRVGQDKFPISKTITGVILELEPGGLRELHWHPNADEWQYVVAGSDLDVTLFGSHGRFRVETLGAGDVGYIPQGYGHSIENKGKGVAKLVIAFNTGHYEAIDLSAWLAANPDYLLRDTFGVPEDVVKQLPRHRVFLASKDGPGAAEPNPPR
ncbi:oxalate decarboxylase : Oxalate decarboxylase OS=Pseudovibrio sp. JE062 GN=PJE062_2527 PE=4 SV=1: Cupin_2: Cupin_2 [Gemmataceae bacterium]|nr:oxalate decarboxylase : Oxalate decarboxylase OS=Pseudovibrio sp. JE062 GN=PJE062_2527 PE=4 SV=1: Cupin_2: Cupin_2 [Gemmataceae bacterium]VTT96844.1 oxalate decarboxylase : Oxalate decarboxylase OS=Pseudovibrio sp. JE062 GN=PJE062_2527 PE=4 SV=1: Cupin_2: Cupin_2 [Gemmataceae bacterium]